MSGSNQENQPSEPLGPPDSQYQDVAVGNDHMSEIIEECDHDFSGDDNGNYSEPIALRDWSARDFADIYVRFYPQVLRQAKRYLTNHSQAEEVTQDAFLYLMTSLPEVDSEIGVLRLLKWKTRLLALDVIKANGGVKFAPLDDQLQLDDPELGLQLERADDAAIVALALAKLEPRQREALIASLYEEKSTREVALHIGITENATRQLVFRSKAAFKRALVGEAEVRGLSLSGILSVAARKASLESGKYVSAASALILIMVISVGAIPNLGGNNQQLGSDIPVVFKPDIPPQVPEEETQILEPDGEKHLPTDSMTTDAIDSIETKGAVAAQGLAEASGLDEAGLGVSSPRQVVEPLSPTIKLASLSPYLGLAVQSAEILKGRTDFFPQAQNVLKIHSGVGLWAFVDIDPDNLDVNAVGFEIMIDGVKHFGSPRSLGIASVTSQSGSTLTVSCTEIFLINQEGFVISDQELGESFITIMINLDESGSPVGASLHITGRN